MNNITWIIIVIILLSATNISAGNHSFRELTLAERIYGLSLIWKEASYNYPYFSSLTDLDWSREYQRYIEKVSETEDIFEYYYLLQEFTALLQDCHTRVILPQDFSLIFDYPLVLLESIEEKIIVTNIGRKHADVLPIGSRILKVDGLSTTDHLEKRVYPYISASNRAVLQNKAMSLFFFGHIEEEIEVEFLYPEEMREEGKEVGRATLIRERRGDRWTELMDSPEELLYHKWLDEEILYIAIYSFNDELLFRMLDSIMPEIRESKGLIIDLRRNKWGRTEVSNEVVKYFTSGEELTGITIETRKHISLYKALGTPIQMYAYLPPEEYAAYGRGDVWHREEPVVFRNDPEKEKIKVPLVILTGSQTAYAAEDFIVTLLSERNDITLVGSHTAGSRGQPLILSLPGGGHIWIAVQRDFYGEEQMLSRIGIQPDIEAENSYEDFRNDYDTVLEKGHQVLRELLND